MKLSNEPVHRYRLPTAVLGLAATSDDTTGYAGCMDGVYRINMETGEHQRLVPHPSYVSSVVLREEAGQGICAGYDGVLKWFELTSGAIIREIKVHDFWSWRMAISRDNARLASVTGQYLAGSYKYDPAAEREPSVRVLDAATGEVLLGLPHVPSVQSVAFSHDGKFVAAGNLMGEVRVWNAETGELVAQWTTNDFTSWGIIKSHCYIGGIFDLHFTPDDQHLILTGMGPMRDPMAGNGKQTWQKYAWRETPPTKSGEYANGEGLMETLAFTPDGSHFVMAGRLRGGDCNAALFATESGERVAAIDSKCRVTKAIFAANGSRLWLAGTEGQGDNRDGNFPPFGRLDLFAIES